MSELNQLQLMIGGFIRKINGDLKS
jgi:hypothetical protein